MNPPKFPAASSPFSFPPRRYQIWSPVYLSFLLAHHVAVPTLTSNMRTWGGRRGGARGDEIADSSGRIAKEMFFYNLRRDFGSRSSERTIPTFR